MIRGQTTKPTMGLWVRLRCIIYFCSGSRSGQPQVLQAHSQAEKHRTYSETHFVAHSAPMPRRRCEEDVTRENPRTRFCGCHAVSRYPRLHNHDIHTYGLGFTLRWRSQTSRFLWRCPVSQTANGDRYFGLITPCSAVRT